MLKYVFLRVIVITIDWRKVMTALIVFGGDLDGFVLWSDVAFAEAAFDNLIVRPMIW